MNRFRAVVAVFSALLFATLTLASNVAFAADKTYQVNFSTTTGTAPISQLQVSLKNLGNSTFNSFTLQIPANYDITGSPGVSSTRGQPSYANHVITVTNIGLPVGSGQSENIVVTINALTVSGTCNGANGSWIPTVYGGSSLNGAVFNLLPTPPPYPTTNFATACKTVTYDANTGSGTAPAGAQYAVGATVTVSGAGALTKTGYTFNGWNTAADGTGTSYAPGATFAMPSSDVTLYAQWTINTYTVSFNSNGGSSVASQNVQYNGYASVPSPAPTKSNSTFAGWFSDVALTNAFNFATTPITGPITLNAKWAPNTLTVASPPTSVVVGTQFSVTVNSSPSVTNVSVTPGCDATVSPSTPPAVATPAAFSITVNSLGTGACTITFSASNYPDLALNLPVYKGVLYCGDYDSSLGPNDQTAKYLDPDADKSYVLDGTSGWGLRRGPNRDGSDCVKVNYSCDLNGTTNIASCSWDKASGQQATFKYVFVWSAVDADSDGFTSYKPQVSWKFGTDPWTGSDPTPAPTAGNWSWVPGLACLNDMFAASPTDILPIIPPITGYTGNPYSWYQPNKLSYVCIAAQGWTAAGTATNSMTNRPVQVQHWVKVIDEADILIKGP